jgi:hypothetical protein
LRFDVLAEAERPRSNAAPFSERWATDENEEDNPLQTVVAALRGRRLG